MHGVRRKRGRSLLTDASNDYRRPHLHMSSDEGETGEHQVRTNAYAVFYFWESPKRKGPADADSGLVQDRLRFHSVEAKLRKAMHQSRSGPSGSGEDVIEKMQEAKRESAPPVVYLTYAKVSTCQLESFAYGSIVVAVPLAFISTEG